MSRGDARPTASTSIRNWAGKQQEEVRVYDHGLSHLAKARGEAMTEEEEKP